MKSPNCRPRPAHKLALLVLCAKLALLISCGQRLAAAQFIIQPQSHLGRLVQSIASPLVQSASSFASNDNDDDNDSPPGQLSNQLALTHNNNLGPAGALATDGGLFSVHQTPLTDEAAVDTAMSSGYREPRGGTGHQWSSTVGGPRELRQQTDDGPNKMEHYQPYARARSHNSQAHGRAETRGRELAARLHEAPSGNLAELDYANEAQPPRNGRARQTMASDTNNRLENTRKHAPSQPRPRQQQQEYRLGAYLGPTIDDQEINGAFGSGGANSNDDSDAYDEPPNGARSEGSSYGSQQHNQRSEPQSDHRGSPSASFYGPAAGHSRATHYNYHDNSRANADEPADDDDDVSGPAAPVGSSAFRGGPEPSANPQAAASYSGQRQRASEPRLRHQQLMAAANGYAPYGYAPLGELSGLVGDPSAGYQIFNGDGSYPNYQQQQQMRGRGASGRRQQAASSAALVNNMGPYGPMMNPWGAGPPLGPAPQQANRQQSADDNEDTDADMDDD